jgi:hypothetical protein
LWQHHLCEIINVEAREHISDTEDEVPVLLERLAPRKKTVRGVLGALLPAEVPIQKGIEVAPLVELA